MNRATAGLDKIAANRINQLNQIAPGLIKGAVKDAGKKKYKLLKKKISNKLKKLKI